MEVDWKRAAVGQAATVMKASSILGDNNHWGALLVPSWPPALDAFVN
jgi:hypothetical protein